MSADWGSAGAQTGAAQGRRLGLRRGADWGCAGQCRRGGGGGASPQAFGDPPRRRAPHQEVIGARASVCARASPQAFGPALSGGGCAGAQTGAAQGRRLGLRMSADWGSAGAQTGAAQGADWGCAGQCRRGGGGASPQAFGDPPRRRAPHQEVIGARASVCARASPQAFGPALSGGGAPGGRSGWFPPGLAQLCMATGQQRLFPTGLMSVHGSGRMGEGPNSRPRRLLLAVPGGGGACGFECSGRRATSHGKTQAASSRWGTSAGLGVGVLYGRWGEGGWTWGGGGARGGDRGSGSDGSGVSGGRGGTWGSGSCASGWLRRGGSVGAVGECAVRGGRGSAAVCGTGPHRSSRASQEASAAPGGLRVVPPGTGGGGGGEVPRRPWIRHVGVWWRQRLVVWVE